MIKIEFPADRPDIAMAFGIALQELAKQGATTVPNDKPVPSAGTAADAGETGPDEQTTHEDREPAGASAPSLFDQTDDAPATADDTADTDLHGVPFNAEFCSKAKDPFYKDGNKRAGQWKKRQGVDEGAYDAWYAGERGKLTPSAGAQAATVDTSAAFGSQPAATAQAQTSEPVPADCGSFMGWVSAKQAAGLLTQEDIGAAYTAANIQVTDLFPPNDEQTVAGKVAALFNILAPIAAKRQGA